MQRGYDQVVHDVAVQNLPVRMILDRAGFVGNDGPTHHGCYDLAYLGCIPNLTIMSPSDEIELRNMVATCADYDSGPTVLRYPRASGYGAEKLQSMFGYKLQNGEIPAKGKSRGRLGKPLILMENSAHICRRILKEKSLKLERGELFGAQVL